MPSPGDVRGDWSRRRMLSALGGISLGVPWLGPVQAASTARAKTVLYIVANGGQSQLDTWDPKPEAPREIRGDFAPIRTAVPGTLFCEHMPRLAQRADKFALIRSMSHEDLDHGSALYLALTGQYYIRKSSNPLPTPNDWPTLGSVVKRLRPPRATIETAIHLNGPAQIPINIGAGQFAGFLGPDREPLLLGDVTAERDPLPGLAPQQQLTARRRTLRESLRQHLESEHAAPRSVAQFEAMRDQAMNLLEIPSVQQAFDLERESPALRERYGLDRSGQALLLARRLVEARVPWITVFWNHTGRGQDLAPETTTEYGWDTHNDIFYALKEQLLPRFDRSLSALLDDLSERGLLDDTLVVCAGEFGRAPLVALEKNFAGESPGRKHWGACYSVVCAGAGVTPGAVLGASDRAGAYPASESWGPWDLAATMLAALGIDPAGHFTDAVGRQFPLTTGRVITPLYQ